jgi:D-glycero-D-manno-heptose 1,7-bisphosphate phosphatase
MNDIETGRPAVYFDRDGVINKGGKVDRVEEFELIPGAPAALRSLREAGYLLVLVTNQTALGEDAHGNVVWPDARLNRQHLAEITARMEFLLGLKFDAIKFCPHAYFEPYNVECDCHKPKPGMLLEAAEELNIDLERSWMIGDRAGDMNAAAAAGVRNRILVTSGTSTENQADLVQGGLFVLPSVVEAARFIKAHQRLEGGGCWDPRNWQ